MVSLVIFYLAAVWTPLPKKDKSERLLEPRWPLGGSQRGSLDWVGKSPRRPLQSQANTHSTSPMRKDSCDDEGGSPGEVEVMKSSSQAELHPRCDCGADMKIIYVKPVLRQLDDTAMEFFSATETIQKRQN